MEGEETNLEGAENVCLCDEIERKLLGPGGCLRPPVRSREA